MESLGGFLNDQFIKIESLNQELQLDLSLESNKEFFREIKKCVIFNENGQLVFNRQIYLDINWGEEDVEIFNYAIKLLKTDLSLAEILFTFINNLEKKDKDFWDQYYKGYEFYPLFIFYMITDYQFAEDFNFFEEDDLRKNLFKLEPENVDWDFFENNLNIDYLEDYSNIISILESIVDGVTLKNKNLITILKSIINDNISRIRNEYIDEEETEIPSESQRDIDILNDLKQKLEDLQ